MADMAEPKAHDVRTSSQYDDAAPDGNLCCPSTLSCVGASVLPIVWLCSCVTVEENKGLVLLANGKLVATITDPGLHAGMCGCRVTVAGQ